MTKFDFFPKKTWVQFFEILEVNYGEFIKTETDRPSVEVSSSSSNLLFSIFKKRHILQLAIDDSRALQLCLRRETHGAKNDKSPI